MKKMKIPKFANETDEANWAYEHRDELAAVFRYQHSQETSKLSSRLKAALHDAIQTKEMVITEEELEGQSLVAVLRQRLKSK